MRNISSLFRRPAGHANHRVLRLVEAVVRALGGEQLRVRAVLDDLAVIDVEDLVRVLDRRQAVRDDEARAPLEQMLQAGLQRLLGARVDVARRLVQDQDTRVDPRSSTTVSYPSGSSMMNSCACTAFAAASISSSVASSLP